MNGFKWNYRIIKDNDGTYSIREMFYYPDGSKDISANPEQMIAPNIEELKGLLDMMQLAFNKPIITLDDLNNTK